MGTRPFKAAIVSFVLVSALGFGAGLARADVRQHGTPAAGTGSGVTTEVLGQVEPASAPGQALFLLQVTFAPGGMVAAHVHPGATIYHVAEGTLQFELHAGEARIVRAATGTQATGTPTAAELIPIGQVIALTAGDTVHYDGEAVQTERNDGDTPAVVLVSNLRGTDEPAREFVD
jgi:quercetin dioxygenase-like cupin family protein